MACFQEEKYEVRKFGGSHCPPEFGAGGYSKQSHEYGSGGGGYDAAVASANYSKQSSHNYSSTGYAASGGGYGASGGGYGASGGSYGASGGGYGASGGALGGYGASGGHGVGEGYGGGGSGSFGGGGYSSGGAHGGGNYGGQMHKPPGAVMCPPEVFSDPFCALAPSSFPPGTDQKIIDCFNKMDRDRSGFICDNELQTALSSYNQRFSMRTVHLLMYLFTNSNNRRIGPNEFLPLLTAIQNWKVIFQRFDRNRNGSIDAGELREALCSLGFPVPPMILNLLISKFDKHGAKCSIEYDNFIECCITVKGLTERFRAKENCGTAAFTYDEFLLTVLPFIVA